MTDQYLAVIILLAVAVILSIVIRMAEKGGLIDTDNRPNADKIREKEDHLARSLGLARERGEVTNDDIERLLHVSDATAERYLNLLESQGHLVQIGKTGKGVRYRVK